MIYTHWSILQDFVNISKNSTICIVYRQKKAHFNVMCRASQFQHEFHEWPKIRLGVSMGHFLLLSIFSSSHHFKVDYDKNIRTMSVYLFRHTNRATIHLPHSTAHHKLWHSAISNNNLLHNKQSIKVQTPHDMVGLSFKWICCDLLGAIVRIHLRLFSLLFLQNWMRNLFLLDPTFLKLKSKEKTTVAL